MDLNFGTDAEQYRAEIRRKVEEFLPDDWRGIGALPPDERTAFIDRWRGFLIENNLIAMHWPREYGGAGLSALEQTIVNEEFTRAGIPLLLTDNDASGFQLMANTLLVHGTQEQRRYFMPRILSGEHLWCQGFSEPGSGSDLASVSTSARLENGEWIINGQKIWTSAGHLANWMFVLVRTNPDVPKHRGLTMLLLPMDQPGVTVRPIRQINGNAEFNEVFFDDAKTAEENVLGEVDGGWAVAMTILGLERGENATSMLLRFEAEFERFVELVKRLGRQDEPAVRTGVAEMYLKLRKLRGLSLRAMSAFVNGEDLGPDAAPVKLAWSEYWQDLTDLAMDVLGPEAILPTEHRPRGADGPDLPGAPNDSGSWVGTWLNSRAATIYSGTSEIQRNIIGERILKLPK